MESVIRVLAESVAEMYMEKRGKGYAPDAELEEFAGLLTAVDWAVPQRPHPPARSVSGLAHLTPAIAAATRAGLCPVIEALRACIGLVPWETYYEHTDWSAPFLDHFASGELVGPSGYIPNDDVSLGLFVLGPNVTYSEHAHAAAEIYYVLGGGAYWALDGKEKAGWFDPGDLVFTAPDQRHEIRTGHAPLLAVYTWKSDPSARSYYAAKGPWSDSDPVFAPLVPRGTAIQNW